MADQSLTEKIAAAKAQGYSGDEIGEAFQPQFQQMRAAGYSDDEIHEAVFGGEKPKSYDQAAGKAPAQPEDPITWKGVGQAFLHGITSGAAGELITSTAHGGTPQIAAPAPAKENFVERTTDMIGHTIADIPVQMALMAPFAGGGAAAGGAATAETGPGAAGGAAVGAVAGAAVSWAASAGATSLFDREFEYMAEQRKAGINTSVADQTAAIADRWHSHLPLTPDQQKFAADQHAIFQAAGVDAAVSGITGAANKGGSIALQALGYSGLKRWGLQSAGDLAAMWGSISAFKGQVLSPEEAFDSAIFLGAFGGAAHLVDHVIKPTVTNIRAESYATGQTPAQVALQASRDPQHMARLMSRSRPSLPVGSSETEHPDGFGGTKSFVIPRAYSNFDEVDAHVAKYEGGLTRDQGGLTNMGISQKNHPGMSEDQIRNLTPRQAATIRYDEYWRPSGAADAPPEFKLPLYDTAINMGVGEARKLYKEANGSLQTFMDLRAQKYHALAETGRYTPGQVKSWQNRLLDQGYKVDLAGMADEEHGQIIPSVDTRPTGPIFDEAMMREIHEETNELGVEGANARRPNLFGIETGEGDEGWGRTLAETGKQGPGPEDNETEGLGLRGAQGVIERPVTHAAGISYETAPSPEAHPELATTFANWNKLTTDQKVGVTRAVNDEILPQIMKEVGVKGDVTNQLGGWEGDTNPNHVLMLKDKAKAKELSDMIGYVYGQKGMMIQGKGHEGGEPANVITIRNPALKTNAGAEEIFKKLLDIPGVSGHTTDVVNGGPMRITLPPEADLPAVAKAIRAAVEGGRVTRSVMDTSFRDYKDYDVSAHQAVADILHAKAMEKLNLETDKILNPGSYTKSPAEEAKEAEKAPEVLPWNYEENGDPREVVLARMADVRKGPSLWAQTKRTAYQLNLELLNKNAPIRKLVNAVQKGMPLADADNPDFLQNIADNAMSRGEVMISHAMIDTKGNIIGKSLDGVMKPIDDGNLYRDAMAYAISKFAINKAAQTKETGVDLDAAHEVVRRAEAGGIVVPGVDLDATAASHGVGVRVFANGESAMFDKTGPHYMPSAHEIRLGDDAVNAEYLQKYGLSGETIKAHELGHALAYEYEAKALARFSEDPTAYDHAAHGLPPSAADRALGVPGKGGPVGRLGRGDWGWLSPDMKRDLEDELNIVSRRFKPGMWSDPFQRGHITKNSELIADGIATWMTDPVARTRMPELHRLIGPELDTLAKAPEKYGTPVQQWFQELMDWQNGTWRYLYHSGLISRDYYIRAIVENNARVPGYRVDEETPVSVGGSPFQGTGKTVFNSVHEFLGSDLKLKNIMESLYKDALLRTQLGDRNIANIGARNAALMIGQVTKVKGTQKITINLSPAEMKAQGLDEDHNGTMELYRNLNGANLRPNEVPIFEKGQMSKWIFSDPDLGALLRGVSKIGGGTVEKLGAGLGRIQRNLIALNPEFPLNIARYDVVQQFLTGVGTRNTVGETFKGMVEELKPNSHWKSEWMRSGGAERIFGGLSQKDWVNNKLAKYQDPSFANGAWNMIKTPVDALQAWGQFFNESQRLGAFIDARKAGQSTIKAGVTSSEAAFHRPSYGGPFLQMMNRWMPFTGAFVHSLELTAKAQLGGALGPDNRRITGEKYNAVAFTTKALVAVTLPVLMSWYMNKDTDWYKAAPDWQKDNGLLFHIGPDDGTGTTIFWKYPPVISLLYGGMPLRVVRAMHDHDPHAWDGIFESLGATLMPPGGLLTYNVFVPFVEHMANYSFFRHVPLISDAMKNRMPLEQYNPYTSELAKNIAGALDATPLMHNHASPAIIDNYIKTYGGTIGTDLMHLSDLITKTNDPDAAKEPISSWPGFGSVTERFPNMNAKPVVDFRDRMNQMDQVYGSLKKAMTANDLHRFQEIAAENPTAAMIHSIKLGGEPVPQGAERFTRTLDEVARSGKREDAMTLIQARKAIDVLRTTADRVDAAPHEQLSPNDKRQLLDQIAISAQHIAERANSVADDAGIGGYHRENPQANAQTQEEISRAEKLVNSTSKLKGPAPRPGEEAPIGQ
jgi:Large polyvalent protein associated domain 38/Glycosyl hydrolase 108